MESMNCIIFFIITQISFSLYCFFISWSFPDLSYLVPIGIINIILVCTNIIKRKIVILLNFIFYSLITIFYLYLYFELLILRGYIKDISDPFLLMGAALHAPIFLYGIVVLIILRKRSLVILAPVLTGKVSLFKTYPRLIFGLFSSFLGFILFVICSKMKFIPIIEACIIYLSIVLVVLGLFFIFMSLFDKLTRRSI
jgi:hypothetical protein